MIDDERYDSSYLQISVIPPSIAELHTKYQDETNWTEAKEWIGDGDYMQFKPLWDWYNYIGDVKYATITWGQDFRTRKYTREIMGNRWNYSKKPIICMNVEKKENQFYLQTRDEILERGWKFKDKSPTIRISWNGALI